MKISKKLSVKYGISARSAKQYILEGLVTLNGKPVRKDTDCIDEDFELKIPEKQKTEPEKYLLADSGDVIFFDKPVFMHSERHRIDDPVTMEDILAAYSHEHKLISRLDFTTDGVIAAVRKGVEVVSQKKIYLAYVSGKMTGSVTVDNLIDAGKRTKVKITDLSGGNRTVFTPLSYKNGFTLVQAEIEKAARHQLRAFLAHLRHPIAGDTLYGGTEHCRIMLHCAFTEINGFSANSRLTDSFYLFSN